jgi:hypothetical protein
MTRQAFILEDDWDADALLQRVRKGFDERRQVSPHHDCTQAVVLSNELRNFAHEQPEGFGFGWWT